MIVLVTGATGNAGRAVSKLLTARGDTVLAVGTDPDRLSTVDAAERLVCDLTDRAATDALAADVAQRLQKRGHASVDGILHLVGGWKPGWSDEVTDWLNARLVTSLLNVSEAFEGMLLAAPAGRLAIISTTAVTHDGPPTSRTSREARRRVVGRAAQRALGGDEGCRCDVRGEVDRRGRRQDRPGGRRGRLADVWAQEAGARVLL
jgi:nucleoside-diphosphate-sugar epimerase